MERPYLSIHGNTPHYAVSGLLLRVCQVDDGRAGLGHLGAEQVQHIYKHRSQIMANS